MSKQNWLFWSFIPGSGLVLLFVAGCNPETQNGKKDGGIPPVVSTERDAASASMPGDRLSDRSPSESESDHGHKAGAHGGIMISLGRDSYHVEAVIDAEGAIRLYTLGKDETRVIDVERQSLTGFIKADGDTDSKSIAFEPNPQKGDAENKTSLFIGKLPSEFIGRKLDITIPNIRIAGERFRLGFQSGQRAHVDSEMPDKIAAEEENELYLQPSGRYTAADIIANGNVTASQRFKGFRAKHDMNPKEGDRICPITETKANTNCSWIVDGKEYQFCCPPCVDEFVKMAKGATEPLPDPDFYLKK
jgi:YHS domain-containing protein